MPKVESPAVRELFVYLIGSIAAAVVLFQAHGTVVTAVVSVPFLLYLPGAPLVVVATFDRRHHPLLPQVLWSVAASIAVLVFLGLLLDLVSGIDRTTVLTGVLIWTVVVTTLGLLNQYSGLLSRLSARFPGPEEGIGTPSGAPATDATPLPGRSSVAARGGSWTSAVLVLILAGGLVAAALAFSERSIVSTTPQSLQLWLVPRPAPGHPDSLGAVVGVRNDERMPVTVVVHLFAAHNQPPPRTWQERIAPRHQWTASVPRYVGAAMAASVAVLPLPDQVISFVYLRALPVPK